MPKPQFARRSSYVAFALVCLTFFFYLGFPTDALVGRLVTEVARQSHGAWQIRVGHASLWRATGVSLDDVHLVRPNAVPIALEAVRLRLRLLPLLIFRQSIVVQLPLGRGIFWSNLTRHGDGLDVHLEGESLDFAAVPAVARALGLPLAGVVDLDGDLAAIQDPLHAQGSLHLALDHLAVGPGNVAGLGLPRLDVGKLELILQVADGRAKLQQFHQTGGTVNLVAQGGVELNPTLARSTVDGCVKVRLDPAFLDKNPKLRSVMQLAEVQLKRDGDGFLNAPMAGPIGSPQLRPGLCPKK